MDYLKERQEAIGAGEYALSALTIAKDKLDQARGWGIFDLLGGGLISSLIKHNRMDDASYALEDAQRALERFHRELGDLNLSWVSSELTSGGFLTFADWFFDSFIADVIVQEKINRARAEVDDMIRRVNNVLARLRNT